MGALLQKLGLHLRCSKEYQGLNFLKIEVCFGFLVVGEGDDKGYSPAELDQEARRACAILLSPKLRQSLVPEAR